MDIYFSDYFGVSEKALGDYGAFNISLVTDLPLFIDPFLLFNSEKPEYQALHNDIIRYLRFLRTKSAQGSISQGLIRAWYCFGEVKQNWFGFCGGGNGGRGLGRQFATALNENLVQVFQNFGDETITRGSHIEKLALISSGVGRDMISDFTTNLTKHYLLSYTEAFAKNSIDDDLTRLIAVPRAHFSYDLERWMSHTYRLPIYEGNFVLLTPKDILTKDDTWISYGDMCHRFEDIPDAVENAQLRAEINNYFYKWLPHDREPTQEDQQKAIKATLTQYPQLIDYYIKLKEDTGDEAVANSNVKVLESYFLYIESFGGLARLLESETEFYNISGRTKEETLTRIKFFKDVIENKGGHRLFFDAQGQPMRREADVQIMFRLVWRGTLSDVSREVNDGRGPADYKISRGSADKTLLEFKLASNTQLKHNLVKQLEIYQKASDAAAGYKVIIYFTEQELARVEGVLRELGMDKDPNIVLIDARADSKPSASKARHQSRGGET